MLCYFIYLEIALSNSYLILFLEYVITYDNFTHIKYIIVADTWHKLVKIDVKKYQITSKIDMDSSSEDADNPNSDQMKERFVVVDICLLFFTSCYFTG